MRVYHAVMGATALALLLSFSGVTFAQSGSTSGSGAGTNVKPSMTHVNMTHVKKHAKMKSHNKMKSHKKLGAAVNPSAAGVAGKKGSKSGRAATAPK